MIEKLFGILHCRAVEESELHVLLKSADLQDALNKNKPAAKFFNDLTYGYKKEYVEWVTTAKREETRKERIAKVVAMSKEGKTLNDKYKK